MIDYPSDVHSLFFHPGGFAAKAICVTKTGSTSLLIVGRGEWTTAQWWSQTFPVSTILSRQSENHKKPKSCFGCLHAIMLCNWKIIPHVAWPLVNAVSKDPSSHTFRKFLLKRRYSWKWLKPTTSFWERLLQWLLPCPVAVVFTWLHWRW